MAYGDNTGSYVEYPFTKPVAPIWTGNSTLALFFAEENGQRVLYGSTPQVPRPIVIQKDVWSPGSSSSIVLVNQ
jgi:hypothetical protein